MDKYKSTKTNKYSIGIENIIHRVYHLQDYDKKYLWQYFRCKIDLFVIPSTIPVQFLLSRDIQATPKLSYSYNEAVVYHALLIADALLENHNITRDYTSEEHKIDANIKARLRYPTFLFLIRIYNLRYKQLNTQINKTTLWV